MLCNNCGKEMADDSLFCSNCGSKNEAKSEPNNTKRCASCGKEFPIDLNYCDSCGALLKQEETLQSSKPPSQQPSLNSSSAVKKQRKPLSPMAIFLISFFATIGISIVIFVILAFNGALGNGSKPTNNNGNENNNIVDNTNPGNTNTSNVNTGDVTKDNPVYDYKYTYTELPDVVSLESDGRFTFAAAQTKNGVAIYTYLFNDKKATEADFLRACDDYSILLQEVNDFIYEEEYTEQQYEETGELANYLTRDNYGVSITATKSSEYYALVSIFLLGEEVVTDDPVVEIDMPNYDNFLAGRDEKKFDWDETVSMDNGLSFMVKDVISELPGNGFLIIEVSMDLSSWYTDYYLNNGDFMILPMDAQGNFLADAQPISLVTNSNGEAVTMPFLVSSSSYEYYTFTYAAPTNTSAFVIYATNGVDKTLPVYVMDLGY